MRKKPTRNNFIYGIIAFAVFVILWVVTFQGRQKGQERMTPRIVVLGDSLIGQCRDETSVTAYLSELLGEPVFNGAMGGTSMSFLPEKVEENYSKELLSMSSLLKSILAGDFGVQHTVRSRQAVTDYFEDNIDDLERIDFNAVDILILEYGINDYHAAVAIEDEDDPLNEGTFAGAIRSVVTSLRKRYPGMRIVMVTPTYAWYRDQELTCEEYDTGNGYLEKYVNAQIDVADEMDVEVIDLYHTAYSHEQWEDWEKYTEDGMHPNETGRRIMAELIAEGLKQGK